MDRLAILLLLLLANLPAQTPVVNFSSNLGVAGASAAVVDPAGNVYIAAGSTLFIFAPDGSLLSTSTPVPGSTLTSLALDAQGRIIVGGNGFVARPPDFNTSITGRALQVAVDTNGNIWASTDAPTLIRLSPDGALISSQAVGGASSSTSSDMVIDAAGSLYLALVTNSAELPSNGFEPLLNGIPGAVSYDGGGYFSPIFGFSSAINQWLLTGPNTMYVATQGQGVSRSTDRGQTFADRSQGLPDLTVNMLAADPTNSQIMYAASAKGLAKTTNGGTNWTILPLPSADAPVIAVAVHPKNRAHLYAASGPKSGCAFYRSTDSGVTWQVQQIKIDSGSVVSACVPQFLLDPNDVNGAYAVTLGSAFQWNSSLSNGSWFQSQLGNFPALYSVAADPAAFSNWYAVGGGGIYKSTDKGASWTHVNQGDLTTIAAESSYVVAGTQSGGLAISRDAGRTWNASTTAPFAQPVRSLLTDSGTIFAGAAYNSGIWLGKFSSFDGQLLTSTFLGGSGSETAARLAVDGQGVVTVVMESDSTDAPTTLDAAQRRAGGGTDLLITRLSPSFALLYASYFGGSADERIGGVKLDAQGFLYVTGSTQSQDLSLSPNALRAVPHDSRAGSAFAAVFNPSANGIVYSSYVDGDLGVAFAPDNRGNAVLLGRNQSDSFLMSMSGLIGYQPIGAIRNAASLVGGSLAPGSLATIDGAFGIIAGISVTFNGLPATIVQSRDTSMDVAVPDGAQPGPAAIAIQSRNGLSQGTAQIGTVAPGLFSANHDGQGVALATLVRVHDDGTQDNEFVFQCANTCVALPIDFGDDTDKLYLQLTATGLRNEPDQSQFRVTVGGQSATVISTGPQGISPGLDQITIQLPRPPDGFVGPVVWSIQVTVDGQSSNSVTILVG